VDTLGAWCGILGNNRDSVIEGLRQRNSERIKLFDDIEKRCEQTKKLPRRNMPDGMYQIAWCAGRLLQNPKSSIPSDVLSVLSLRASLILEKYSFKNIQISNLTSGFS
jgi:hypothetical protein